MNDVIAGEGLVLRPPVAADRERWLELYRDPDELRWGVPSFVDLPATIEDLDERIETAVRAIELGEPALFAVSTPDDDRLLGKVGWRLDAPPLQIADVGYGIHPDSRRQGVVSRSVRVLTRWLTVDPDGPGLPRVQLDHSVENLASCRTALSAGFEKEGVRRGFLPLRDDQAPDGVRRHDVCLHGYLPT